MKKYIISFFLSTLSFSSTQLIAQTYWNTAGNTLVNNGLLGTNAGSNYGIIFRTNGVNHGMLTNTGNWGIGTIAPISRLHVAGNQTLAGNLNFTNSLQSIQFANPGATSNPMMYMFSAGFSNPARMVIGHSPANAGWGLQYTDNVDRFDFLSPWNNTLSIGLGTGLVGIGTNAPQRRLHVVNASSGTVSPNANSPFVVENNNSNYISVLAPAANERGILFGDPGDPQDGGIIYNGLNNELQFRTNGNNTRMTLKQDGKLGIGTSTPGYLLDVAGRMRIRTGGGTAGTWLMNAANTGDIAFVGMLNDSYVGLYGSGAGWGFLMNATNGNIGIGTASPAYKLDVCGTVRAKELRVETGWCDYVFEKDYQLPSLNEVEEFIKTNKHLPDVTPGHQIENNGLEVGKISSQMIKKIEELTLYVIELQKQVDALKSNKQ